jgi:hypothetical protein
MHIGVAHREGGVCGGGGLESDDVDDSPVIELRQEAGGSVACSLAEEEVARGRNFDTSVTGSLSPLRWWWSGTGHHHAEGRGGAAGSGPAVARTHGDVKAGEG